MILKADAPPCRCGCFKSALYQTPIIPDMDVLPTHSNRITQANCIASWCSRDSEVKDKYRTNEKNHWRFIKMQRTCWSCTWEAELHQSQTVWINPTQVAMVHTMILNILKCTMQSNAFFTHIKGYALYRCIFFMFEPYNGYKPKWKHYFRRVYNKPSTQLRRQKEGHVKYLSRQKWQCQ